MERTIFALFEDAVGALLVASSLERDGFARERITLLVPDPHGRYARVNETPAERAASTARVFRSLSIPGLPATAVTGPLGSAFEEAQAETGGLTGALLRLGFQQPAAQHYFESLRRGQALLAVEASEDSKHNTVEMMRRLGARAVDEVRLGATAPAERSPAAPVSDLEDRARTSFAKRDRAERSRGSKGSPDRNEPAPLTEPPAVASAPAAAMAAGRQPVLDEVTVPVIEERLEVAKRQAARGGVRVNSRIVEQPVEESVSLREERLHVERRPVSREATEADLAGFKEGSIEIHETVEEPVISKVPRVVEEVVIGKETLERTQTITETLRKTEVSVEPLRSGQPVESPAAAPPPRHDPYAAAHRYGYELARDERYRDASWKDIEPQARRAWETEAGNEGSWDRFKDSVRGAWQKMTGHEGRVIKNE